ncbi:MAG: lysylphosphatidylglycerol synthase domain-containing protein [Polyangiaceae bacterium]
MGVDPRIVRAVCGVAVVACAAALLARVFASVDVRAVGSVLVHAGPRAPLATLPFLLGMAADAAGMAIILGALGRRLTLAVLLPLRVATEALHMTAPAGFLVADTTTAALLGSRWGVPLGEGAVLAVARKWLVMRAHAAYILFGTAVGSAALAVVSQRFFGVRWIGVAAAAALAMVPFVLSSTVGLGFAGRSALESVRAAAERLPWRVLREKAQSFRRGATAGDALLARVGADRGATGIASLAFLGCWLAEALDTAVILWIVTGRFDVVVALAVETGVSMLRSIANIAPAGLGVQEVGYGGLLTAMGVPVDGAAAFVLLKRCKELVWIAVGYVLLACFRDGSTGPQRHGHVTKGDDLRHPSAGQVVS